MKKRKDNGCYEWGNKAVRVMYIAATISLTICILGLILGVINDNA